MKFNLADVFETVADSVPERIALSYEGRQISYAELDGLANQVAHLFAGNGIGAFDNVALFLKNSVEHVTSLLGLLKVRAVPVNINYRYTTTELQYIFDNSDSRAIIVELPEHQRSVAELLVEVPTVRTVFVIGDIVEELTTAAADLPGGRTVEIVSFGDYESKPTERDFEARTGEELYLLYTGGTTGYPKGVMWQHDDFFRKPLSGGNPYGEARKDLDELGSAVKDFGSIAFLLAAPLMHGAASYSLFTFFTLGGRLVIQRDFDPAAIVTEVEREKVNIVLIVGDAMGMPLVEELEKRKGDVDLSSMFSITSGGAIWSQHVRDRMLAVKPDLVLRDNFGASESGNDGEIVMDENGNLKVPPTDRMMVVDDRLNKIEPGSGDVGYIARIGNVPLGYYKDEEKSAKTFPTLPDGRRISILGDMGTVEADGSIVFLGRGSQCINTGGEKVYAEEVEAALHAHPAIADALVVPVPDEKYGQRVAAVARVADGAVEPSLDEIQQHCRETLAGYKVPRTIVFVDEVKRTPAGKADYRWAKNAAAAAEQSAAV
ncbi:AMP-dependent synthetase and ligase [Gordonia bronchialis DSM 43247]|uniref:AMP-dependent synthetase and ligase n=1 Tax=Gordonia bronchialis (strain ATCC 25592 / DSM 43247 / BCRC 13721 / JCM 3198 / KCTC 3076 / NBRC 16047 / NCTC 10667) TaxID=526226 RepID=D0L3K2_GORB4|nr:AMP-binding protein [Gordonia bronchialis]ACY20201.1 AMP-dependent synthetase and ligase [Gordonia bronchialis DSM 43247]MCC3322974.1 AMP-binding protein [Gordonia bronchialis]QGS25972.1 AMP-binding protein [Gordonia bronchialis]UAK37628.1 AMP-binding protein [Gordonia bronchialis]STQ63000.1 Long-chain-fatty-acid--CoA ligase FadD19 [Gordonia bronchialis]